MLSKITQRFIAVVSIYVIGFFLVISAGIWGLVSAKNSLHMVHDEAMRGALLAEESSDLIVQSSMQILLAFQHAPDSVLASIHDHPTGSHTDAITRNRTRSNEILQQLQELNTEGAERPLLQSLLTASEAWRNRIDEAANAVKQGNFEPATMAAFLAAGRREGEAATQALRAFRDHQVTKAVEAAQAADARYQTALLVFGLVVALGLIPGVVLTFFLAKRLRSGFELADNTAAAIAGGDLSKSIPHAGNDEIGKLLNQMELMRVSLYRVISEVQRGSGAIASAATQVAAGTLDLSQRTEQQASSLEQTASASEELSGTVQHNAQNATQANQLAGVASQVATHGGQVMGQVVQTMEDINTSSRKIADIISVIDGIAFQTNILALNAAVEAARAGEQGRGFAVVAGEVRSLAGRSAEAAKEIKSLIEDSVQKVGIGTEQVAQAGQTMNEIVGGIKRVADIVAEIAAASQEQAAGIAQINNSVTQLDNVTQQNAALVEETSAASSALQEQAKQLAQLSASFRLGGGLGTAHPALPRS